MIKNYWNNIPLSLSEPHIIYILHSPVFHVCQLRQWKGYDPLPFVPKLSVGALRNKGQRIVLDEYSRLVTCFFLRLGLYLT